MKYDPRKGFQMLTTKEAAQALRLSERSIFRLIDDGELRRHQFGRAVRISPDDLDAYIARCRK